MRKKILFLGCNINQIPYLNILKKKWKVIGVDKNKLAPGLKLCHNFYNIGYDDLTNLIEIGKKEKFTSKDKIFTASAQFAHYGAACFAEYFDIKYPTKEMIKFSLNKYDYYNFFKENNIPFPNTRFIKNEEELKSFFNKNKLKNKWYYLKSDLSKNPNYVYRIDYNTFKSTDIFWGNDRYLSKYYILQDEFKGTSLRINIYNNGYNIIDFISGSITDDYNNKFDELKIIFFLKKIIKYLGMNDWLLKFDIIINNEGFAILDIGIDPPSRMKNILNSNNINFEKLYLDHYLNGILNYPKLNNF